MGMGNTRAFRPAVICDSGMPMLFAAACATASDTEHGVCAEFGFVARAVDIYHCVVDSALVKHVAPYKFGRDFSLLTFSTAFLTPLPR